MCIRDRPDGNLAVQTVNEKQIPVTEDDAQNINEKIQKISSSFDIESEDKSGEFIAWWLDKYRKSHAKVKEVLQERFNIEDTLLQEMSESIGFLFWQYEYPQSRYTHYADEFMQDTAPIPYNSIIEDKLELEERGNIVNLNSRVEALFRRNIQQVIKTGSLAGDAHGENLVTDHYHYERLKQNQHEINENISNTLGAAYKVLLWISMGKVSNKQKQVPACFQMLVEDTMEEVDLLLNKIKTLQRPFNISILN